MGIKWADDSAPTGGIKWEDEEESGGILSSVGSFIKENAVGAFEDTGKGIQTMLGASQGFGGQLAKAVKPEDLAGVSMAGVDLIGGLPGFAAGALTGAATDLVHNDPVGGKALAEEIITKATPSHAMGLDMSKNRGYALGMKPIEVGMEAAKKLTEIPGWAAKNIYGLDEEAVAKLDARTYNMLLAGMGASILSGKGGKAKDATMKKLVEQFPELKGMTEAEAVAHLKKKYGPPSTDLPIEQRTQGELFDTTPPEGQFGTTDPMAAAREAAQGELRTLNEQASFGEKQLSNGQAELFPRATGLERPDIGLEPKRTTTGEVINPDGIPHPTKVETGLPKTRSRFKALMYLIRRYLKWLFRNLLRVLALSLILILCLTMCILGSLNLPKDSKKTK